MNYYLAALWVMLFNQALMFLLILNMRSRRFIEQKC